MKRTFYLILSIPLWGMAVGLPSCSNAPSAVEQRKAEIREHDSLEIVQAQLQLQQADSLAVFKAFELEDLKGQFVFEKQEEYQTTGYYVLPKYAGNKSKFVFFPEVEEGGALLLVSINKKREYSFQQVDVTDENYVAALPQGLSDAVKADIAQCYALAKAMHDVSQAKETQEKLKLKIRFYQEKQKRNR